jgi:hypothetical protein
MAAAGFFFPGSAAPANISLNRKEAEGRVGP